jgi:hypothetical protein
MNETPATVRMIDGATTPAISNVFVNNACAVCTLQITGSFTAATVLVEGIVNVASNQWVTLAAFNLSDLSLEKDGADKAGIYQVGIEGILRVRMNVTEVSGGDITIAAQFGNATINQFSKTETSNLIPITAYDMAVAGGYTGTLEQFEEDMGNSASNATAAAESAASAAQTLTDVQTAGTEAVDAVQTKGQEVLDSIPEDYTELTGEVSDLKTQLNDFASDTFETVTGKNLYNPEDTAVGCLNSDGSVSTASSYSAYLTSGFIPVENDTTYFFTERTAVEVITSTRYTSLLYSEDKTPITESYQNIDATSGIAIVVNDASAKYMRVSVHYWDGRLLQVEKGESATSYQPYSKTYKLIAELGDTPAAQVMGIIDDSGLFVTETGRNLVDSEKLVEGAVQSTGVISTTGSWATYSTSDFISLEENTDYVFSTFSATTGNSTTNRKTLLLYDEDLEPIDGTYQNVDRVYQLTFNSSDNAKFVRVSSWTSNLFQLEKGTQRSPYAPYKSEVVLGVGLGSVPMAQAQSSNTLYGKKWAVCGDSFTNGATSGTLPDGKYQGYRKVYPYYIGNRNNMDILKFFEGGRTLAFPSEPGTFTNSLTNPEADWYYQNIPADADYITIYLGINDEHHSPGSSGGDGEDNTGVIPLGTIDDTTTATYLGAWNVVLTWLITNRPNAHIGIIVSNGIQAKDEYRQGQIAIAGKYGIPYIDLNGDARTPAMLRTSNPGISSAVKTALIQKWAVDPSSNTHPNDAAHEFESTSIENFLRSL